MQQSLKDILSKLKVAGKKKKKLIILTTNSFGFNLLNFLWREGFIYGYYRTGFQATVFLKYFFSGSDFFSRLIFFNLKFVSWKKIKLLAFFNKNSFCFVWTVQGIFSFEFCIKKKLGGYVIGQL